MHFCLIRQQEAMGTVRKYTFQEIKGLEREPFRYCKGDENVTFRPTRLFFIPAICPDLVGTENY